MTSIKELEEFAQKRYHGSIDDLFLGKFEDNPLPEIGDLFIVHKYFLRAVYMGADDHRREHLIDHLVELGKPIVSLREMRTPRWSRMYSPLQNTPPNIAFQPTKT